jgi:hypothetical protein
LKEIRMLCSAKMPQVINSILILSEALGDLPG